MDSNNIQTIQTVVLCVIGIISSSMIPFALMVVSRITRLETQVSNGLVKSLALLSENLVRLATRVHEMEVETARQSPTPGESKSG